MRKLMFWLALALALPAWPQNLVPNPSFEEHSPCPDWVAQIDRAVGWEANAWTPDYFNACDTTIIGGFTGFVSVPANFIGFQPAASGVAYAGVLTFLDSTFGPNYESLHEYIGIYLTEPLEPGVVVYLSFKASSTYGGGYNDRPRYVCSGVGMKFTMQPLNLQNPQPTNNVADMHLEEVLDDSASWTLVRGAFIPDSAYQYLVIGNFFDQFHSDPQLVNPNGNVSGAYAFIDDVCVSYDSTEYQFVGVGEVSTMQDFSIIPNPCESDCELLFLEPIKAVAELVIYDPTGRQVSRATLPAGINRWPIFLSGLATGPYTLTVAPINGRMRHSILLHTSY